MGKLICKVKVALLGFDKGHKWVTILVGTSKSSTAKVCLRCRENGWILK